MSTPGKGPVRSFREKDVEHATTFRSESSVSECPAGRVCHLVNYHFIVVESTRLCVKISDAESRDLLNQPESKGKRLFSHSLYVIIMVSKLSQKRGF